MKHFLLKFALAAVVVVGTSVMTETVAKADGYYYYGGPSYYVAPVPYFYQPVYVAPAPVVNYGYGYWAGPPVYNMGGYYPAYYYPETVGVYPYYPAEVKYKFKHGMVKVEIDD